MTQPTATPRPDALPTGTVTSTLEWLAYTLHLGIDMMCDLQETGVTLRDRLKLQVLRIECRVDGFEMHDFTVMTPGGPVIGNSELGLGKDGLWHSTGPNYEPDGKTDANVYKSRKVFACGSSIVQRHGRAHKRKHTLIAGVGVNVQFIPQVIVSNRQACFGGFEPAEGKCDVLGGTRRVSSRYRDVASVGVLMIPAGSFCGPANHAVCNGEDGTLPSIHSQQAPVNVLVGMRRYEVIGAFLREFGPQLARALLDAVVEWLVEGVFEMFLTRIPIVGRFVSRLFLRRILGPLVSDWLKARVREFIVKQVTDFVGDQIEDLINDRVGEATRDRGRQTTPQALEDTFNRWMEQE